MKPEFTAYQDGPHSRVACVAVPHRPGRDVVREVEAVGHAAAVRGHASTPTRGRFRRRCRTCGRRATPASSATGRRSSTATRSARRRIRRRREEHRVGDDAAGARRRRQRAHRRRAGHPLAHERRERDRLHRDRRQASGDSVRARQGPVRRRARVRRRRRDAGATREGRAAAHGLHGLPQPSEPSDGGDARARGQRAMARAEIPRDAAVRPARGGEGAEGELSDRGRGDRGDRQRAARLLSRLVPAIYMSRRQDVEKAVPGAPAASTGATCFPR